MSFAYCGECHRLRAEPYGIAVGIVSTFASEPAHVAEWFLPVIEGTCQREGKSVEDFWKDVRAEIADAGGEP